MNHPKTPVKVVGLVGHPIGHTLFPLMYNTAFEVLDLNYTYLAFDVHPQNVEAALRGVLALGIGGVDIATPHRENVMRFLDEVTGEASLIGAVNVIVNDGERLVGYNTDAFGFVESLRPYKDELQDQVVSLIGAGGGARAAVYGLVKSFRPKLVNLVHRNADRVAAFRKYVKEMLNFNDVRTVELFSKDVAENLANSKLIINATPIGMWPRDTESVIETDEVFSENQIVFDLVYTPLETKFLQLAKRRGARTISGLDMFVYRGAKSFEIWTDQQMPVEEIRKTITDKLLSGVD
jgi:shikimate dehydrogenase